MTSGERGPVPGDRRARVAIDLGAESCRVSLLRWGDHKPKIELVHRISNGPVHRGASLQLARALATLDQATGGGRVTAGLGSGWSTDEYAASGADFARRGQSLDEMIDALRSKGHAI